MMALTKVKGSNIKAVQGLAHRGGRGRKKNRKEFRTKGKKKGPGGNKKKG